MTYRQATHLIVKPFWVLVEEPPGGGTLAARGRILTTRGSGFLMNCLAVMNTRQVTRTNFGLTLMFWVFWDGSNRGKSLF